MNLSFSPSGMSLWLRCREAFRYKYLEGIEIAEPNIHLAWGRTVHRISEGYWQGLSAVEAHNLCLSEYNQIAPMELPAKLRNKWLGWGDSLAETIDLYYEHHGDERETIKAVMLEKEFCARAGGTLQSGGEAGLTRPVVTAEPSQQALDYQIVGRIDQLLLHPNGELELRELKTASEIVSEETNARFGFTDNMREKWRREYREQILRNLGIQVYDWYLCQLQVSEPWHYAVTTLTPEPFLAPRKISVEVILKPYRDKKVSMETLDLTKEIVSYRDRTSAQIEWVAREMAEYHLKYSNTHPWPMSQDACFSKFGACEYLPLCNHGVSDKTSKLYQIRSHR